MRKLSLLFILSFFTCISSAIAQSSYNYYGNDYAQEETYCAPEKTSFLQKVKNTFVGQPTGLSPDVSSSPYLNHYGPSYMRGYYGTNGWNDHNSFNPTFSGARIHILD